MYVDNYEFKDWMQKLLDKLEGVGQRRKEFADQSRSDAE